jgi:hypothetical protein
VWCAEVDVLRGNVVVVELDEDGIECGTKGEVGGIDLVVVYADMGPESECFEQVLDGIEKTVWRGVSGAPR